MCLMSPFVIVALRSSQSFIVGLGTVYVGIRHRLAPAFVFVTVLTVVVCLTTSWWVYPPLTAIVTGSMSPLTKAAILVLIMFHIGSCDVSHSARSSACVAEADASAPPFLAVASHRLVVSHHDCAAIPGGRYVHRSMAVAVFLAPRLQRTRVRRRSGRECAAEAGASAPPSGRSLHERLPCFLAPKPLVSPSSP